VRLFRPELHSGAKIGLVLAGSPAEKAGISTGDIITHWGPDPVDSPASLSSMVRQTRVKEKVRVTLIRAASAAEEGVDVTVELKPLQF
jgi:S1-C subfamily serine protease